MIKVFGKGSVEERWRGWKKVTRFEGAPFEGAPDDKPAGAKRRWNVFFTAMDADERGFS